MGKIVPIPADKRGGARGQLLKAKRSRQAKGVGLSKFAIWREESRQSDSRGEDRHQLGGTPVRATYQGRSVDAQVLNLSGGGAMIGSDLRPHIGDRLDIHLGSDTIEVLVRWVRGGRIGVEFTQETRLHCPDDTRAQLLRDVITRGRLREPLPGASHAPQSSDDRSATRHPFIWAGELVHGPSSWPARLRDISPDGALVQCNVSLAVGSEVLLDLGEAGRLGAAVRWTVGDCTGLQFDKPFDLRALARFKPLLVPRKWLRPTCLEKAVPEESAWDQAWGRMSAEEMQEQLEGFLKR
jgi:PilZ domain-containing protein